MCITIFVYQHYAMQNDIAFSRLHWQYGCNLASNGPNLGQYCHLIENLSITKVKIHLYPSSLSAI